MREDVFGRRRAVQACAESREFYRIGLGPR